MASGRLRLQLLDFFLDQPRPLLGSLRALLDLLDLDLDPAHGSPVESRAQVARCI
jgi:glyoxylase-like metal-dependent hydrolase (beta-lactamase superfamily II)